MESEFLLNLKEISVEVIVIAFIVFGLTMLIKWPIKKFTSKLDENKRKAVNTVIVFIPMLLSILFNGLYYGIFKDVWFSEIVFKSAGSIYISSVAIYAVYSRILILIKGTKSANENNDNFSKETIAFIKKNIKVISKTLKTDESNLKEIVSKIENLLNIRKEITNNVEYQDIATIENIDNQVNNLKVQKSNLDKMIDEQKEKLIGYQNSIKNLY